MLIKILNNISNNRGVLLLISLVLLVGMMFALHYANSDTKNLLGIIFNFFIAGCTYYGISSSKKHKFYWFLAFGAILSWAFCDTFWMFLELNDYTAEIFKEVSYVIPAFLIFLTTFSIYKRCIDETRSRQLIVDVIFIVLMWVVFSFYALSNSDDFLVSKDSVDILNGGFLILDILCMSIIFIIFFSIENFAKERSTYLLMIAIGIFSCFDVFYVFMDLDDNSLANTLYETIYELSFVIIMLGSFFLKGENHTHYVTKREILAKTIISKILALAIIPLLICTYVGFMTLTHVTFVMSVMLLYGIVSYHTATKLHTRIMLENERKMTVELEKIKNKRISDLKATRKRLSELSKNDFLTSALNKQNFELELSEMIMQKTLSQSVCLYNINIDKFKFINNTHGHYVGDEVLIITVDRLKNAIKHNCIIGRFGGDNIMVAFVAKTHEFDHSFIVNNILFELSKPMHIERHEISVNVKIGISHTQTSQLKTADLIANASVALKIAKHQNDKQHVIYNEINDKINYQEYYIKSLLDSVNFEKEFRIVYQPQFDIKTKKLIGIEALLRWHSPLKGNISPAVFIPIAEQMPLIVHIGRWVLQQSALYIKMINEKYGLNLYVSVNISPKQIDSINFVSEVLNVVKQNGLKSQWLHLEITEMSWLETSRIIKDVLKELNKNHINISIDDFGTGFSSISYLNKFRIAKLKIAKELIDNIQFDKINRNIVIAIVSLAKNMNIQTVAKGVESQKQVEILKNIGCDEIQGYFLAKPMEAEMLESFIASRHKLMSEN